jgi:hypothetical protein
MQWAFQQMFLVILSEKVTKRNVKGRFSTFEGKKDRNHHHRNKEAKGTPHHWLSTTKSVREKGRVE